ncbi:MAG: ClpXP protease specificity-enhancing factor [Pseudomonadales bacterium]|jgi:stringent starvation protein B|uniref:ClpXP protease specificity-enhancing factor n=1 Tax=unclassified Ketobacter TaxID=2639109 RepID=UPI000C37AA63|nr:MULTISPECIES: ClpXP protease specificity-enhancing factor [unclassified Ketobacter]MAA59761.1 ClpXP protease specificity-enhancing factor [Pseudomonadales bacterium]MEC8811083.1 ClpXP protease specificity-enhancing factor [Pseudomonadota bacterium]TNC85307.1 MAG: ClpXP protease specificity-enhancing factor [Alcanivorax sp.]HAG95739.1 ClpXP protease specificity-enhancing factor [Gammaproteobacteria bacterium]MAQ25369.1 ClpXP protease specificity-enhancing factor [Pseudomonadales bacterium]|tara:strand:+ start:87 stop:479 length:393 start_codon:yes stop_codon:yes gene_type:complete
MTPSRPYFIRAVYEWILDNQLTPYLLVKASYPMVQVPNEFVSEGKIILNLAPSAIRNLHMGNDEVEFSARFGGKPRNLHVPVGAILAIYAKENGKGMFFDEDEMPPPEDGGGSDDSPPKPSGKPSLKVVK